VYKLFYPLIPNPIPKPTHDRYISAFLHFQIIIIIIRVGLFISYFPNGDQKINKIKNHHKVNLIIVMSYEYTKKSKVNL